jgi:hypothetical protein
VQVNTDAREAIESFGQEGRPMVGMNADNVDYCGMCGDNVKVEGAGADNCLVAETCDAFRQVAPAGVDAAFDWKELSFDPWYIVQGTMNPATDKALDVDQFRDGLRSFLIASEKTGVQVTAYSTEPDPLFKQMMPNLPGLTPSNAVDADHKVSTPMKVVFLVNDKAQADSLKKALKEPDSEEHDDMLLFLQVRSGARRGARTGWLAWLTD